MSARILKPTKENIMLCAQALKKGGVVGMPTETVYGLAGNATDSDSLTKIFLTKERPTFDPLIVHVSLEKATFADLMREQLIYPHDLADEAVKKIDVLIRKFWPGPLTLVLPKSDLVSDLATSGLEFVAIRMPKHPVALELIRTFGLPVCAPSANRFGKISPTSAQDVEEELGDRIDLILDGGDCEVGLESTILKVMEDGDLILLRPGAISREEIMEATKSPVAVITGGKNPHGPQMAPGMGSSHYSPDKKMIMLPMPLSQIMSPPQLGQATPKKIGLLVMSGQAEDAAVILSELLETEVIAETLSESGDWAEAGKNLFKKLRALDASDAELILCEPCLETQGIGYAVADRLKRASAPKK